MLDAPTIDLNISRKIFNEIYLYSLEDDTRTQIYFGGSSSGKSHFFVGQRVVWDLCKGGRNYLILRNVARTSRKSTFNMVKQTITAWNLNQYFNINKSDMVITCKVNGYQAFFEGMDDVEKLKSIVPEKGIITDILCEEATEIRKEDDVILLEKRLRGKSEKHKRMTLLFNPVLKSHWIFKRYFSGKWSDGDTVYKDDSLFILKTTHKDNRFLEPEDRKALEDESSEYHYNVYTLGNWGVLGDLIFKDWRIADLTDMMQQFDNIRNGLDFGYGSDPMAFNRMHYDKMRKKIYIFKEFHIHELTNPEIIQVIGPTVGKEIVTCDSAEPKSIKELRDGGLHAVGAKKGPDSVNHGIQFLRQNEVIIHNQCQYTINEWEQYQWKKNKDGDSLPIPVDINNHHIDDVRYGMERDMTDLRITPRLRIIGMDGQKELYKEKPPKKPGKQYIEVWEGDKIVGYEEIGGTVPRRSGVLK